PSERLRLDNVLTVAWDGRSGASGPFVMLQPESELYFPREFGATLPDLALLRSSFYPLSLQGDLSDCVVLMPQDGGEDGFASLCELAALLGRLSPGDHLSFTVARAVEPQPRRPNANLILLETARGGVTALLPLPDTRALPRREALGRLPWIEARVAPWNPDKNVLRVRAASPALLRAAVRSLARPGFLERLSGDTAFLAAEGPLCFRLGPPRTFAEVSYLTRLEAWLRDNWLALPAILAVGSGLLFMALRLTFERGQATRATRRVSPAA
ncbi:MAG TPA: cellulose biosynthesis cyclic di-GMP-binding regulatory protein BcsB, partial [Vicinamibacteria bacterium]|nr:cellulose biosynthesis cyclic di-GMP-binding regulatory protein BcsB [Vicinamibacteria bacterium]